jgi:predicted MFS family arabinose efflux permease
MSKTSPVTQKSFRSRLFLLSLLLGYFLTFTFTVFLSNAMVSVATTLKVTVGTASQILTISSVVGLIVGLLMGILTVRFSHKTLFLIGVAFLGIGALGWFLALDFALLLFFSFFLGIGSAMTSIVVFSLIGDFLPLEKKGMAVGLAMASAFAANLVVPQVTSAITITMGWRAVLLWFIFPISIFTLLFGFFILPSKPRQEEAPKKPEYLDAFKKILLNKSALSCVLSSAFISISFLTPIYAVSFYALFFKEPLSTGATFYSLASAMGLLGVLAGGRLINRVGRKPLAVAACAVQGIFGTLIVFMPNPWVSAAMWMVSAFFASVTLTSFTSLALEQVQDFRGTMMSMEKSFQSIGLIVGLIISGLVLNLYDNNFQVLFIFFGICAVVSAALIFFFTKDSCRF